MTFSGEFPAEEAGVATADAALDEAGVVFGGVAITCGTISPLQMAMRSIACSLSSWENHLGMRSAEMGGQL